MRAQMTFTHPNTSIEAPRKLCHSESIAEAILNKQVLQTYFTYHRGISFEYLPWLLIIAMVRSTNICMRAECRDSSCLREPWVSGNFRRGHSANGIFGSLLYRAASGCCSTGGLAEPIAGIAERRFSNVEEPQAHNYVLDPC